MIRRSKFLIITTVIASNIFLNAGFTAQAFGMGERISGKGRYETAIEISKAGWTSNSSKNAVLATGEAFPDALCAAPLAKMLDAPVLLTGKSELKKELKDELDRLGVENVFIVGGKNVISEDIEKELEISGRKVERLYGNNRYETAIDVAKYIAESSQDFEGHKTIVVATGSNYPDALSIAPVAAKKGMPIILSPKDNYDDLVKKFVEEYGVKNTYVIGGKGVISDGVLNKFPTAQRISGEDRYETNINILNVFKDEINIDTVYFATGNNFPDALSGAALASRTSSPLVLVDKKPYKVTKDFVSDKFSSIRQIKVLGGEGVVLPSTLEDVLPKITSIDDISITLYQGESYTLPQKVEATFGGSVKMNVFVDWNGATVDTSKANKTYTFKGTVVGYDGEVTFRANVEALNIEKHPIMGESDVTPEQMTAYVTKINPNFNPEIAETFIEVGKKYGVRGDIAFAQSIHETNWFRYGGDVKPDQNNFAGIGATGGVPGYSFATIEEGVTAQILHLLAYASTIPVPEEEAKIDPRFHLVTRGIAPNWEDLGGKWAVPGYDRTKYRSIQHALANGETYGQRIYWHYEQMKKVQIP